MTDSWQQTPFSGTDAAGAAQSRDPRGAGALPDVLLPKGSTAQLSWERLRPWALERSVRQEAQLPRVGWDGAVTTGSSLHDMHAGSPLWRQAPAWVSVSAGSSPGDGVGRAPVLTVLLLCHGGCRLVTLNACCPAQCCRVCRGVWAAAPSLFRAACALGSGLQTGLDSSVLGPVPAQRAPPFTTC